MSIEVTGARVNNLKNIDVSIPRDKLVVITGLSGSGKSSLAFDTIYAEGQRRYMETLSAYARQFMGALERPEVDSITGLSPIIAIEQKTTGRNPRSTVGTITEIYDFIRLLFARASKAYSPVTGLEMIRYSDEQIVSLIIDEYRDRRSLLLSPLIKGRKGHYKELFEGLIRKGFLQVRVDGQVYDLTSVKPLDRYKSHFIELVVDKLIPTPQGEKRVRESVLSALYHGKGSLALLDEQSGQIRHFSKHLMCPQSGISYPEPAPHTFSFNSPQGACPHCKGLGMINKADLTKIIPNDKISIANGGITPLGVMRDTLLFRQLEGIAKKYEFSLHDAIKDIPEDALDLIIYGSDELFRVSGDSSSQMMSFGGVILMIEQSEKDSDDLIQKKERFVEEILCPVCKGTRLKEESLSFRIDNMNISQISAMDMDVLFEWVRTLDTKLDSRQKTIARDVIKELTDRVGFLLDVGLNYLSLDRSTRSLSGGESQRIRLATQIGSKLVNVLYILDEPSIGLHQRDNIKLIDSLRRLRDEGNSIMVVEHDQEMISSADWLVDMGPGAGEKGGKVLYCGAPGDISKMTKSEIAAYNSLTLDYMSGEKSIEIPQVRRKGNGKFLELFGSRGNNLKGVNLKIPLGCLIGVSGVSGSGKSSLINETLMPILSNYFYRSLYKPLPYTEIKGINNIDKLIEIDQSPIGRTPRSNPATYTNVFADIRKLFGETPDAKIRGFKPGRFSFNVKGGRCEGCKGAGVQIIEMNFLPSVHVHCKECNGKRYTTDTLAVKYRGKSIYDVLEMTISQALIFFEHMPSIVQRVKALEEVGLGYVKLGQSSTTLSGGESQRVKLAAELSKRGTGNSLYILDEPTTGLHFEDVRVLLDVLQTITNQGNTVLIIEHNLDVLRSVDYIIDMGPQGGAAGGEVIACGTPEEIRNNPLSVTGRYI
ncbi:MAG TPA: excinuclease ABC subunit UvrA [Rikenellaceae bacterium]|nr:MAG: excinuclease ABC subunit A [Bacteroidetes bacterium GWE2_40_15]HBZ25741.1 excinuclease ABC subunit UvrA [Rikenellaceae bacterium]